MLPSCPATSAIYGGGNETKMSYSTQLLLILNVDARDFLPRPRPLLLEEKIGRSTYFIYKTYVSYTLNPYKISRTSFLGPLKFVILSLNAKTRVTN